MTKILVCRAFGRICKPEGDISLSGNGIFRPGKLKAYGRDHEIAILLVGERVREEAKEIKAGLKMLLCDGEFVSQEEASVYKFQSGDCILQEVMACYCTVPPEPGLALIGKGH